jgi:hypothetical protein
VAVSAELYVPPAERLDTLPNADLNPDGSWNRDWWLRTDAPLTLGWAAIAWVHGQLGAWGIDTEPVHRAFGGLRQPNGPRAGHVMLLTRRQQRFLLWWYSIDDEGRWLFHHSVRRLAKGSGKSPFAAMFCLLELCGPVRVVDLDPSAEDPAMRVKPTHVRMPWVQIAATTETQTHNTMRMVRAMAAKGTHVQQHYGLDPGKTMIYTKPEGKLEIITSSFTAAEGAEPSALVGDETEHSVPANGGPELMRTLADNAAKSGARMMETCNAWIPGLASVAESTFEAWVAQEEGRALNAQHILYDAVRADHEFESRLHEREYVLEQLERVYEDCDWKRPHKLDEHGILVSAREQPLDLTSIMTRIYDPRSHPDDSVRKYGNLPTAAADAWTTVDAWALLRGWREVDPAEPIALFFDGSKSRDATALVGCAVEDGYTFLIAAWERPSNPDGKPVADWEVPVAEVDRAVRRAHEAHHVVGFYADVREWESFVHSLWPDELPTDRYMTWAKRAGHNPGPIAWDMRGHVADFTSAAETTLHGIDTGSFKHDGHPLLSRHIGNARRRPNNYGTSIGKESPDSARKIDGAVCVIGAQLVRRQVLASDDWKRRDEPAEAPKRRAGRVTGWS